MTSVFYLMLFISQGVCVDYLAHVLEYYDFMSSKEERLHFADI